jgi:hypothetical protein
VRLSVQDQSRISGVITRERIDRVTNVNFSVRIGVEVPSSVRLHPVPTAIVDIVPEYRDYNYFVTIDSIVIVEPQTYRIVEVLPYQERGRAETAPPPRAQAAPSKSRLELSQSQREVIRKHASSSRKSAPATVGSAGPRIRERVRIEEEVPDTIELHEFPDTVVKEVPAVRPYRFYMHDDRVILVNPARRRVYDVIE